jgi:hypothetical protein
MRLVLRGERPPEPDFAGDPQLALAVQALWDEIGPATGAAAKSTKPKQTNSSNSTATAESLKQKNESQSEKKTTSFASLAGFRK